MNCMLGQYLVLSLFGTLYLLFLTNPLIALFFEFLPFNYFFHSYTVNLNLINIYVFPFLYIFTLITIISILFSLSYNLTELMGFMFYSLLILLAGYILFFTDSIILFFLAYEILLVPSFFILYNFAKTRRSVEAAYLMFF